MIILGLNFKHADASACLISNGKIIAAAEEERFVRLKHYNEFPVKAISFCLKEAKISLNDVDYFTLNNSPSSNFLQKIQYGLNNLKKISYLKKKYFSKKKKFDLVYYFKKHFKFNLNKNKISYVDHHLSHISSAYYCSKYKDSVVLSIDGSGDFTSAAWGEAINNKIKIHKRIFFPNSLGIFYETLTQYLGFKYFGDEYKVMGLAAYGKPIYYEKLKKIFFNKVNKDFKINQSFLNIEGKDIKYRWQNKKLTSKDFFKEKYFKNLLKIKKRKPNKKLEQKHIDLAASVQRLYEEFLFIILKELNVKFKSKNLCFAGGCAMNSVANGKIKDFSRFKNIFIQPASGDAGGALGSALYVYNKHNKSPKGRKNFNSYLGPNFSNDEIYKTIEKKLKKNKNKFKIIKLDSKKLSEVIAKEISTGAVVGFFHGKMEWGARALGNRSILCDPRNSNVQDLLNKKIKRRESFRPYAPSILREKMKDWFLISDEVPHMMQVYKINKKKQKFIPAVTHVDGTGRLQSVKKSDNLIYYNLIKEFYKITKIPMLLNTSFNENEPIVCNPDQAINTFLRTKLDLLVMENWVVKR